MLSKSSRLIAWKPVAAAYSPDDSGVSPRSVTLYDLDSAMRVVSFGCDIASVKGQPIDQWDVPAVSDGYAAARDRIVANVERLVADLTSQR